MLNIYEKAREFKEKYEAPLCTQESKIYNNNKVNDILKVQIEKFARNYANYLTHILVLEHEITILKNEIENFLNLYYRRYTEISIGKNIYHLSENLVNSQNHIIDAHDDFTQKERRSKAYNKELKSVYHRLVKICHPDSGNEKICTEHFIRIQNLYETSALHELLYIETKISENINIEENIIKKLERIEISQHSLKEKLKNLKNEKSTVLESAEYRLFIKYKLSEIRGCDFFDEIFESSKFERLN